MSKVKTVTPEQKPTYQSFREYFDSLNGSSISPDIRINVSGLFFITILRKDGTAENLYLSKNVAEKYSVAKGTDSRLLELPKKRVTAYLNEEGELRHRLSGAGAYLDLEEFGF